MPNVPLDPVVLAGIAGCLCIACTALAAFRLRPGTPAALVAAIALLTAVTLGGAGHLAASLDAPPTVQAMVQD